MNMVGPLKTLSWRPPHWIYQHHYSRLQWNIRSCKPNLEAIQDDLGPGRKAAKLRDQHIKSTGHCENTKGNIWKNTNGKRKGKTKQDLSDTSCSNSEVFQGWPTATEQNCALMVSTQSRAKPADKNACTVHLLQTSNTFNHMLIFNIKKCINKRDDGNHQKNIKTNIKSCFLLF